MENSTTFYFIRHGGIYAGICDVLEANYVKTPNCCVIKFEFKENTFLPHEWHNG